MSKKDEPVVSLEVERRVKEMRNDELLDFVRDTIVRLESLADRLEVFADQVEDDDNGDTKHAG